LTTIDTHIAERTNKSGSKSQGAQELAVREFIANKNFEQLNLEDFDTFYKEVAMHNPAGVATGSASKEDVAWYVDAIFGDGKDGMISEETAKAYGYKTG
jgi:hypothetical protein